MKKEYVAIIDSGIGGISTLINLNKELKNESFIYLGDNSNAPYGNKSKRELLSIVISNLTQLNFYNVKYIVVGCNTMSLMLKREIEEFSGKKVFCVFPPVESELIKGNKTLLLSTFNTALNYGNVRGLNVYGFYNLASDIENNVGDLSAIDLDGNLKNSYSKLQPDAKNRPFDVVILGCTHFEFIKNKIFNHFLPKKIISGNFYTLAQVRKYEKKQKKSVKHYRKEILFLGKDGLKNKKFYQKVVAK